MSKKFNTELEKVLLIISDNETVMVQIELKKIDRVKAFSKLAEETGMNSDIYEDTKRFEKEIVPGIRNEVKAKTGKDDASSVNNVVLAEMDKYIEARNKLLSAEVSTVVDAFIQKALTEKDEVLFASKYLETVIVKTAKARIHEIADDSHVVSMSYFKNHKLIPGDNIALTQIKADAETGTNSNEFNNDTGYSGTGVKVGILEAYEGEATAYDSTAYQLVDPHNAGRLQYIEMPGVPDSVSTHATLVTSIVTGSRVTVDGNVYQGVVPDATVYQIGMYALLDLYLAIEMLVDLGVSVINASISIMTDDENETEIPTWYTGIDYNLDQYILNYNINFVTTSQNLQVLGIGVTSPGKAYNVITVGNARTKSGATEALPAPYSMNSSSGYTHNPDLTNKPDVCAPGSSIACALTPSQIYSSTGTSFSSPLTAGMVAQMIQARPSLKTNTTAIKNYVMLGASNDVMTGTTTAYGLLEEQSGAGFINAIKSVVNIENQEIGVNCLDGYINSNDEPDADYKDLVTISLEEGQKIRAVLYYQHIRPENSRTQVTSRFGIRLVSDTGETLALSASDYNTTEIIEYTAAQSGDFSLQKKLIVNNTPDGESQYYWISWYTE